MPAHWYYNPQQLRQGVGIIRGYMDAPRYHAGNTLMQSQWEGNKHGVRDLVDKVMLFGKTSAWQQPHRHFHDGMKAGENTLNARCALLLLQTLVTDQGQYSKQHYLRNYVAFHKTPHSHNDSYAEGHHRQFMHKLVTGRCSNTTLDQCAGDQNHDTSSIGAFVTLPPVVFALAAQPNATLFSVAVGAREHVRTTHRSLLLGLSAEIFIKLLLDITLNTKPLRQLIQEAGHYFGYDIRAWYNMGYSDLDVVHRVMNPACYIHDSFPVVLYLAYKSVTIVCAHQRIDCALLLSLWTLSVYLSVCFVCLRLPSRYADRPLEEALLAQANVGGECCHRGSALGALLGAAKGMSGIPRCVMAFICLFLNVKCAMRKHCRSD